MMIAIDGYRFDTDDVYMIGPLRTEGEAPHACYSFTVHFYNGKDKTFTTGALLRLYHENAMRRVPLERNMFRSNDLTEEEMKGLMPGWDIEARKAAEGALEFVCHHKGASPSGMPKFTLLGDSPEPRRVRGNH